MREVIGFVGTGAMGLPMARNLLAAGFGVRVYNRTAEKTEDLVELGAVPVSSPADVAERGGIAITMIADDAALGEIAVAGDALVSRLGTGGIHLSMGTVSPAASRRVAAHHLNHGVSYVAAPVFGRPDMAAAGKLLICVSGPADACSRVEPLLKVLGQALFRFGEDPGAANVAKLTGNFLIASMVEALSEAAAFAEKGGIDKRQVLGMLTQTLFACPVYQNYAKAILDHSWDPPGFRLRLGLKDLGLVLQTAREAEVPMPLASLAHGRLLSGVARGWGELDFTSTAMAVAGDAGLDWSE